MKFHFYVVLACVCVGFSQAVLPTNYLTLSATQKRDIQWEQMLATRYDFNYLPSQFPIPGTNITVLNFASYYLPTFLNDLDEQPPGRFRQTIGNYGVVCKIKFITFKNSTVKYTGVYNSGGIGIFRISLDGQSGSEAVFNPLTGTKIYIDGRRSVNMLQVHDLLGQAPDLNIFRDEMNNIIDSSFIPADNPKAQAFTGVISLLPGNDPLARPQNNSNLGTYDTATVYSNGTLEPNPRSMYRLNFVPNPKIATPSNGGLGYRREVANIVKPGDVIYTVYAQFRPTDTMATREIIGQVICDSEFVASMYGDLILFFRHPSEQWRLT